MPTPLCGIVRTHSTQYKTRKQKGVIKTIVGASAGFAVGALLFRSGGGWRAASSAVGVGAAWGSTYERAVATKK
jgi:Domain of unknown function (DUF543)